VIIPPERQEIAGRATQAAVASPPPRRGVPNWLRALAAALAGAVVASAAVAFGLARLGGSYAQEPFATSRPAETGEAIPGAEAGERAVQIERKLAGLAPSAHEVWVAVDTYANRLRIYRGQELLREAVCSTGSGVRLRDPRNGKEWIFDTPQGELKILRKAKDPVWVKPDWAFIEDGYLPPKGMRDRIDDFSLGDYGLYMRDGYIIHGTIFKTLLGKRVTHGCIRLGDEDLIFAFKTVPVGARVYVF
jgi:lipoprotein-anchoring transpeptidase ErfK/SrfK